MYNDIKSVLSKYQKDGYEFDFSTSNGFDGFKIQVTIKSEENNEVNVLLSKNYGFTQNIVGMTFISRKDGSSTHEIVGFRPSNRLYKIITKNLKNGKNYKFSINDVKISLGGDKLINRFANLEKLTNE